MSEPAEITPTEFVRRWHEAAGETVTLLDVREPEEIDRARVAGSLDIPMLEIPARLSELDGARPIVVMCHSGQRSRQVARFLAAQGFEQVFNLSGGITAWSQEVDPSIPRY